MSDVPPCNYDGKNGRVARQMENDWCLFWKGSARLCAVVLARKQQQQKLLQMCDPHRLSPVLSVALTVVYCASHLETG